MDLSFFEYWPVQCKFQGYQGKKCKSEKPTVQSQTSQIADFSRLGSSSMAKPFYVNKCVSSFKIEAQHCANMQITKTFEQLKPLPVFAKTKTQTWMDWWEHRIIQSNSVWTAS